MISGHTGKRISLPGSADGLLLSGLPDGAMTAPSGPARVPVRRSVPRARKSVARSAAASPCPTRTRLESLLASRAVTNGTPMSGTCGRSSTDSLPSADLQSSLANRLLVGTDLSGSPEYALLWKTWDMTLGLPICALRATARRISDNACSGWPTPRAEDSESAGAHRGVPDTLTSAARLSGWPTTSARDGKGLPSEGFNTGNLPTTASLAGLGTPNCMDALPSGNLENRKKKGGCSNLKDQVAGLAANAAGHSMGMVVSNLDAQAQLASGTDITSSTAATVKRGALNPNHSRWLMGYPVAWQHCADMVTRLSRRLPRSSSKHTAKPGACDVETLFGELARQLARAYNITTDEAERRALIIRAAARDRGFAWVDISGPAWRATLARLGIKKPTPRNLDAFLFNND